MITISEKNAEKIRKFKQMLTSSYYADGGQVTEVYNEVFGRNERPTNCGSCIRQRMTQLVGALDAIEKKVAEQAAKEELPKEEMVENTKKDVFNAVRKQEAKKKKTVKK